MFKAEGLRGCQWGRIMRLCVRVRVGTTLEIVSEHSFFFKFGLAMRWVGTPPRFMRGSAHKLILQVLGTKDGYFYKEQFTCNNTGIGIVENSPYRHLFRNEKGKRVLYKITTTYEVL